MSGSFQGGKGPLAGDELVGRMEVGDQQAVGALGGGVGVVEGKLRGVGVLDRAGYTGQGLVGEHPFHGAAMLGGGAGAAVMEQLVAQRRTVGRQVGLHHRPSRFAGAQQVLVSAVLVEDGR